MVVAVNPRDPHHTGHRAIQGGLARAAVFGASDGLVSNVSLLLGFAGSGVAIGVVRLAGVAGAVAGGISMAAGEWVSVSSQNDLIERELDVERRELRFNAEQETAELAAIYEGHGMGPEQAASAAEEVMRQPDVALIVHAREEFGIDPSELPSPVAAAVVSLICFLFGASLPLIPWFFTDGTSAAVASLAIGLATAAVVGGLVGKFAERSLPAAIMRQVLIVIVACTVTYVIGEIVGVSLD
jgi:VIT1/CCC1 family predicted Fe2+/Mn2+ transporter